MVTPLCPAALLRSVITEEAIGGAYVSRVVAVDGMAVEVKSDVVGPDHQSVPLTVGEVVVQRRVGSDRVAATHGARERGCATQRG
jgi:hypothetical protein